MKHLIKLTDYTLEDLNNVFTLARAIKSGLYKNILIKKTILLFFPSSSIRTRVTFEKGIHLLGGQSILFPSDTFDNKEKLADVAGYLNNWADCVVIRHNSMELIKEFSEYSAVPVINAMTEENHPCEVLSDLFAISQIRKNYLNLHYTFVGTNSNIGKAWAEAAIAFGISFTHCCPQGYEIENSVAEHDMERAMEQSDIVITDSIPETLFSIYKPYQITESLMRRARPDALLNPCPPFTRGMEVSEDATNSDFFVGYEFKKSLLYIQLAIILYGMGNVIS